MEDQAATETAFTGGGGFASAEVLDEARELLSKESQIAVPTIVMMSIVAFLAIIGLSWLMDGKKTRSAADTTTPKKQPKLGLTVTPAGERRSTRKSHRPDILDPSQPTR